MAKKENQASVTQLGELGEFGLIQHLTENIKLQNKSSIKGIGDDSAVIDHQSMQTVVSTDMLVEGVHFDLLYTPLKHLGYKAVIVNISDIYAMNANPKQITVSIAASNRISVEALEDIYEGIQLACNLYKVDLIGGDTTSSTAGLVISITAIGEAKKEDLVYRNGAQENDLICVSGDLGSAYMGLQLLEREKKVYNENQGIQPDLSSHDYLLERQLKPEARKNVIDLLHELKIKPTAMIDVSDGLSSEILHICRQSNVGCNLYEQKLPIDMVTHNLAAEMNINPMVAALNGGEDYELLFTVDMGVYDQLKDNEFISIIGNITSEGAGKYLVTPDNQAIELTAQGWDALLDKEKE